MREEIKTANENQAEAWVIRALERRPEIPVPEDFTARVARSLPAKVAARPAMRPVFGQAAGYLAVAAMTVVLMVLARMHPEALEAGRGFLFGVELLLVAQLLAVGFWLGTSNG